MTDFVNEVIIVKKKIRFPFTSQHVLGNNSDTFLVRVLKSEVILPGEYLDIKIPKNLPPNQSYLVENRTCPFIKTPMILDSVGYKLKVPNIFDDPVEVKKHSHIQLRRTETVSKEDLEGNEGLEYPKKPNLNKECQLEEIQIDPSGKLFSKVQKEKIKSVLKKVQEVFSNDDSTYKGEYKASFEFSTETRPVLKN